MPEVMTNSALNTNPETGAAATKFGDKLADFGDNTNTNIESKYPNPEVEETEELKEAIKLDEQYMDLENAYLEEWALLQAKFEVKQKPLLEERKKLIGSGLGPHFWLKVLQGHPIFNEEIHDHDFPALECLSDLRIEYLECPEKKRQSGFKVIFEFNDEVDPETKESKLPFNNKQLIRVYETGLESKFLTEICVKKIYMEEEIDWKIGKDVTVKLTKATGKNKKVKSEPQESFFRQFFRTINLHQPELIKDLLDKSLQEIGFDVNNEEEEIDEEDLEEAYEEALEKVSDDAYEMGLCLRDNVVPFAVRFYTGEAVPEEEEMEVDSDAEEGEEGESDEEDGEDKKKKKEECKQQ